MKRTRFVCFCLLVILSSLTQAQKNNIYKLGFTYGKGAQNKFPFNSKDYNHTVSFYKVQINHTLKRKGKWAYEINVEAGYYLVDHQLLNKWFIKESDGKDYLEQRALFTQKRTIEEYALNLGLIVRYSIYNNLTSYTIGSFGPMVADKPTERLAKGFAFSNVFGLGMSYQIGNIQLDFRCSLRHTSNQQLKKPNSGHNTTNMAFSVFYVL